MSERRRVKDINGVLEALNWCAGFATPTEARARGSGMHDNSTACEPPLAVGQAKAEARAVAGVDDLLGGEAIPLQRSAFLELLKGRGVYDVDTAGMTLAPFTTVSAIPMPQTTAGSPWRSDVAPGPALQYLERGTQCMLRTEQEF